MRSADGCVCSGAIDFRGWLNGTAVAPDPIPTNVTFEQSTPPDEAMIQCHSAHSPVKERKRLRAAAFYLTLPSLMEVSEISGSAVVSSQIS